MDILRSLRDKVSEEEKVLIDQTLNYALGLNDVDAVLGIIFDELMAEGFHDDKSLPEYTANEYGWELEELIDAVNRPRLVQSSLPKPDEELLIGKRLSYLIEYCYR